MAQALHDQHAPALLLLPLPLLLALQIEKLNLTTST